MDRFVGLSKLSREASDESDTSRLVQHASKSAHEDVEKLGAGSRTVGVEAFAEPALGVIRR